MAQAKAIVEWRSRVPWVDKLRPDLQPKVVAAPSGRGTMLVPTPLLLAEELRRVKAGRLVTPAELRDRLARRCGADRTCPLTTGILLHIVAGAAEEQLAAGKRPVGPYWRVVDEKGYLNPRWALGPERQAAHLRREGHQVKRLSSGRWQVVSWAV